MCLDFKSLSTYEYIVQMRKEDEERARAKEIEEGKNAKNANSRSTKQNQVAPDDDIDQENKEKLVESVLLFWSFSLPIDFFCLFMMRWNKLWIECRCCNPSVEPTEPLFQIDWAKRLTIIS